MEKVAVIIVNWNGKKYLKDCLGSIEKQTYQNFDIFLVDNNSIDNSLAIVENYKKISIIKNKENYGFAKGNNIGIEKALQAGYKYIVLVNLDTIPDKDWLKHLVERARKTPEIGAVQSKILLADSGLINTTGGHPHYLGFSYCGNYKCVDNFNEAVEIPLASGASTLFLSEALKKTGLFDKSFFMYLEDADLSWRMRLAGYKIMFEPKSIIYHKYSFSKNKTKLYYAERNRLIFVLKNYELKTLIFLSPVFVITEILMVFHSLFGGWFKMKIKGYLYVIKNLRSIFSSRRAIQKMRKIKDCELKRYFITKLSFEEIKNPLFSPLNIFFKVYWIIVRPFI